MAINDSIYISYVGPEMIYISLDEGIKIKVFDRIGPP